MLSLKRICCNIVSSLFIYLFIFYFYSSLFKHRDRLFYLFNEINVVVTQFQDEISETDSPM